MRLILMLLLLAPSSVYALNIPLSVAERANTNRSNEVVSYGVPIAKSDNIQTTSSLGISDGTNNIPSQFRVLSRYGGQANNETLPIRMVLVDFLCNIDANMIKTYYLVNNNTVNASGVNLAYDDPSHVTIDNGFFVLKIRKTGYFNLFDSVSVNDNKLIDSNEMDGIIVNYNGTDYTSFNSSPTEVLIEENGPLKAVVLVRGQLQDINHNLLVPPLGDTGLTYSITYRVHKNQPYVKVDFRLESENFGWTYLPTFPAHHIVFKEAYLRTTLNLNSSKQVSMESYTDSFTTGTYEFLQDHQENTVDESGNFVWSASKGGMQVSKMLLRSNGLLKLGDGSKGIKVSSRWYWQNWPKAYKISDNVLSAYLWPEMGYDHKFLGGSYKTHEMIYCFDQVDCSDASLLASLQKRLIAVAPDSHYAQTNFFRFIAPGTINSTYIFPQGEKLQVALDQHKKRTMAKYDSSYSDVNNMHETLATIREKRPLSWTVGPLSGQRMNSYGWLDFGDMPRGGSFGFPALHYNWDYLSLISFLRFQKYDLFEMAEEMVRHKSDIDFIHDPRGVDEAGAYDEDYYRGGQRYENDAHMQIGESYAYGGANSPAGSSHSWIKGLLLQYLLTGDERINDVIQQIGDHYIYAFGSGSKVDHSCNIGDCWDIQTRHQSRGINNMVALWELTGEKSFLVTAYNTFTNGLLTKEYIPEQGFFDFSSAKISADWCNNQPCDAHMFYEAIANEPLINLYFALDEQNMTAEAQNVYNLLWRRAIFMRDTIYKNYIEADCGTYIENQYYPYGTKIDYKIGYEWPTGQLGNSDIYSFHYADIFAFLYTKTNDINWMNLARTVFKDYLVYPFLSGSYQNINLNDTLPVKGFITIPQSAWLKEGYDLYKPMFYLSTESEYSKTPILKNVNGN